MAETAAKLSDGHGRGRTRQMGQTPPPVPVRCSAVLGAGSVAASEDEATSAKLPENARKRTNLQGAHDRGGGKARPLAGGMMGTSGQR